MATTLFAFSRSLYGTAFNRVAPLFAVSLAALCACNRDAQMSDLEQRFVLDSVAPASTSVARLRLMAPMQVASVQQSRKRTDVALLGSAGFTNPDSEQVVLDSFAERIWQDTLLGVRSETVAIAVRHPAIRGGAVEQTTYFFYRSRRATGKQP